MLAAIEDEIARHGPGWARLWGVPDLLDHLDLRVSTRLRRKAGWCAPPLRRVTIAAWLVGTDQLVDTLCHELAHLANYRLHGRVAPHGPEWRALMVAAGYSPAVRFTPDPALVPPPPTRTNYYELTCTGCGARFVRRRWARSWRCAPCVDAGLAGLLFVRRLSVAS